MLPAEFDYVRPPDLKEVLAALSTHGEDGKVLAGGQSLIPLLKLRFAAPVVLIDINRVPGLEYIRQDGRFLRIGACTRQATLASSDVIHQFAPAISAAS